MVPRTKPDSGFYIGVGCPGCGGELELDSDFFVLTCKYCGSVLRVMKPETPVAYLVHGTLDHTMARFHLDRYLKQRDEPLTGSGLMFKQLYYPYWKVDGRLLKLRNRTEQKTYGSEYNDEVEYTVESDKTYISVSPYAVSIGAGPALPSIPDSLGMRTEHITILPYARENVQDGYDTISITRSQREIQRAVSLAVATIGEITNADFGVNVTRLYDPVFSLVYFPYVMVESYDPEYRRFALDGLTGRVIGHITSQGSQLAARSASEASAARHLLNADDAQGYSPTGGNLRVKGTRPDHVQFDGLSERIPVSQEEEAVSDEPLDIAFGELQVDFHRCTNCGEDLPPAMSYVYVCKNCHSLRLLDNSRYSISQVEVADVPLDHDSKLIPFWWFRLPADQSARLGVLMGGLGHPERLVVPALYTRNFEAVQRLAKRMTAAVGRIPVCITEELDDRYMSVRISLSEAVAQAEMIVTRELLSLGRRGEQAEMDLQPTEVGLLYIPFKLQNYFYTDTVLGAVSLEKVLLGEE